MNFLRNLFRLVVQQTKWTKLTKTKPKMSNIDVNYLQVMFITLKVVLEIEH